MRLCGATIPSIRFDDSLDSMSATYLSVSRTSGDVRTLALLGLAFESETDVPEETRLSEMR